MKTIRAEHITHDAFAEFGDVVNFEGPPDKLINDGLCGRFHDRARLDFGDGRAGLSLFDSEPRSLPYSFDLVERHPDGSQAFIPMSACNFLVVVAPDDDGVPGAPRAFLTRPFDSVNFHRGTWHGVLTPLDQPGRFAVIDRIGSGQNLEEYRYNSAWTVEA